MKFPLGQTLATPGAIQAMAESNQSPGEFLSRHAKGDWGCVCREDAHLNDLALEDGSRILSAYTTKNKVTKLWVITEADRSATTLLLPEEY